MFFRLLLLAACRSCALVAQSTPGLRHEGLDRSADPAPILPVRLRNWVKATPFRPTSRAGAASPNWKSATARCAADSGRRRPPRRRARDAVTRQIGDYYAACMDEKAIDARGLKPVQPELDRVRALPDRASWRPRWRTCTAPALRRCSTSARARTSRIPARSSAQFDQGGLGRPTADYYLKDDAKSVELRAKYLKHVARMFELAGEPAARAQAMAGTVMRLETALAQGALDACRGATPRRSTTR